MLDRTFAAPADPTRCAIVSRLCQGEAPVGELARPFSIGLPTLIKHIRALEDGGLVTTHKAGRVRTCTRPPRRFEALMLGCALASTRVRACWSGSRHVSINSRKRASDNERFA